LFIFTPKIEEDEPILTHIFQMGWFNHQLVIFGPIQPFNHLKQPKRPVFFFRKNFLRRLYGLKAKPELNGMIGNCIAFDKSWGPKLLRRMTDDKKGLYIFLMIRFERWFVGRSFCMERAFSLAYQKKL